MSFDCIAARRASDRIYQTSEMIIPKKKDIYEMDISSIHADHLLPNVYHLFGWWSWKRQTRAAQLVGPPGGFESGLHTPSLHLSRLASRKKSMTINSPDEYSLPSTDCIAGRALLKRSVALVGRRVEAIAGV